VLSAGWSRSDLARCLLFRDQTLVQLSATSRKTEFSNQPANAGLLARGLPSRRILLVGSDEHVRWLVAATAREVKAEVRAVDTADRAAVWLRESPVDLVVVCGAPAAVHAPRILAAARSRGRATPCLVVSFIHPCLAQVLVCDSAGRPTSTKVVDRENLARLPSCLISGEDPWRCVD
jgi:hypothetical protein